MPSSERLYGVQDTLVQLPNKDLWRGSKAHLADAQERPDTVDSTPDPKRDGTLDGAMAAVYASAKGASTLTCLWCGAQYPYTQAPALKDHIAQAHMLAVTPVSNEQALAVLLAEQQAAGNDIT